MTAKPNRLQRIWHEILPPADPTEPMTVVERMRYRDSNPDEVWIHERNGWITSWGWSWFSWAFGVDLMLDRQDTVGAWINFGPLSVGTYRQRSAL